MANITRIKAKDSEPKSSSQSTKPSKNKSNKSSQKDVIATRPKKQTGKSINNKKDTAKTAESAKSAKTAQAETIKHEEVRQKSDHTDTASSQSAVLNSKELRKSRQQAAKDAAKQAKKAAKAEKRAERQQRRQHRKPLPKPLRFLLKPFTAFGGYVKHSWQELRQVRWPNRKTTWKMTIAVLFYTGVFIVFIMLLDALFTALFNNLLG